MYRKVTAVALITLSLSVAAFSQSKDHRDSVIHYIACDQDIAQPIPADDGRILNRRWSATWNGNGFQHSPMAGIEGAAHPDTIMRYLTWDGQCWEATWDSSSQMFVHKNVLTGKIHTDKILNYLTWDRSKWSTVRDGNDFYHFFVAEAEYKKSKWQEVREFINNNKETITVVISWFAG
jgi:hypothetical protein